MTKSEFVNVPLDDNGIYNNSSAYLHGLHTTVMMEKRLTENNGYFMTENNGYFTSKRMYL